MSSQQISFSTSELAEKLGGTLRGPGEVRISGINGIGQASASEVTFVASPEYAKKWPSSSAGAALVSEKALSWLDTSDGRPVIVLADSEVATITILDLFSRPPSLPAPGIHPSASIDSTAIIGKNVRIAAHVAIGPDTKVGDGVVLFSGVCLYGEVEVGDHSVLNANVVVRDRCKIGARVLLHQGVSIGADGFGYRADPKGGGLLKVPHIGNVVLEDDVEIGANSCVDRGKFGSTVIGRGTKIDNLCQIGHNCIVGRNCVMAAHVGLAGSTIVEDWVQIGGRTGVADHVRIGKGSRIGGGSGIFRDVPPGSKLIGYPANEFAHTMRIWAAEKQLPDLMKKLRTNPKGSKKEDA